MTNRWQDGRKTLVVGAGKSGIAAARTLARLGAAVTLCDTKTLEDLPFRKELEAAGVVLHGGGYPSLREGGFREVVMSPGVPLTVPPAREAQEQGLAITGELEIAYCLSLAPFIAITGTNGKTTTTSLVGAILKAAGRNPFVGGNIGQPLVEEAQRLTADRWVVAEVSSFQLETTDQFHPRASLILNITPDHLDRHGDMENYRAIKARIFRNQGSEDITVLNYDDPLVRTLAADCRSRVLFFSRLQKMEHGAYVDGGMIRFAGPEGDMAVAAVDRLQIKGAHNVENALAACALTVGLGIAPAVVAQAMIDFQPVEHRMEPVGTVEGVAYVNDSKGTNPDASIKAIESYDRPVILIAGGKNKGSDFSELAEIIKKRVKAVVLVGQAAPVLEAALRKAGVEAIKLVDTFDATVLEAAQMAEPGDVVLLSPACASLDMFPNYEVRGQVFKDLVRQLARDRRAEKDRPPC
ncbi:udp-n-acetylmuramoylalanine--d-glutamate ligase, putative [Heliomicrobium modesticaldum Ice1]|uniref:UDP-N-acetylmuramoylalanine--D-glutamate ligase n=1 Tax=Heliobacterium modesticaldum (strain ATCC 51547 / Ice1) TaxID=498761 RepID=B0TGB8_HELMI|nr:UDP-N-acetylmuramoyl-L-alanine--D-glutamate ligase [Heliomicrobium modesticaldum]ABZ84614.1 udp-n-acetylmuramoylalanine--d-glutamate ligase, putative [Heliomicrobium modesticaldum Ice1]